MNRSVPQYPSSDVFDVNQPGGGQALPPGEAPAPGMAITPAFAMHVARRWWKLSTLIGLVLAAGAGAGVILSHTPVFKAECWLEIVPKFIVFAEGKGNDRAFARTQQELIKSPPAMIDVLAKPEIASLPIFDDVVDPVFFLRKRIQASPQRGTNVYTISLQSDNRESVAPIVNAVLEAYLALINTRQTTQDQALLALLKSEQRRKQTEIETLQERVKSLSRQSVSSGNPLARAFADLEAAAAPVLFNPVATFNEKLYKNEVAILNLDTQYKVAEAIIANEDLKPNPKDVDDWLNDQLEVKELLAAIANLQGNADSTESSGRRRKVARTEMEAKEADLKALREKLRPQAEEAIVVAMKAHNAANLATIAAQLEAHKEEKKIVEVRLKDERSKVQKASDNSLEFEFMAQDLQREKAVADRIANRIQTIETEARALGDVTVLIKATAPKDSVNKFDMKRLMAVMGMAFLAPFGLFFLYEMHSHRVGDAGELSKATCFPVVGEVASLPVMARMLPGGEKRFEETLSRFEESIEYLRTSILLAQRSGGLRSLVVCSAVSREGKSTIAAHLASSVARTIDGKVLLIDADMRRPSLHRLLDHENDTGLVDYLACRAEYHDVIRDSWIEDLDFVSAGTLDTPVAVLLASNRLEQMLRQAEGDYAFVVIDVPPILPVSDGVVIAGLADAAIFCGLRDVSTLPNSVKAAKRLRDSGVNVIGSVFSGTPAGNYGSSAGYYYRIRENAKTDVVETV